MIKSNNFICIRIVSWALIYFVFMGFCSFRLLCFLHNGLNVFNEKLKMKWKYSIQNPSPDPNPNDFVHFICYALFFFLSLYRYESLPFYHWNNPERVYDLVITVSSNEKTISWITNGNMKIHTKHNTRAIQWTKLWHQIPFQL